MNFSVDMENFGSVEEFYKLKKLGIFENQSDKKILKNANNHYEKKNLKLS